MAWFDEIQRVSDIPGLEALGAIARDLKVSFTLVGSVCRRIVMARIYRRSYDPASLFDLVPFLSDIDIVHSGDWRLNAKVEEAIAESVPCFEAFRWQVMCKAEYEKYDTFLRKYAHRMPGSLLSLGDEGLKDESRTESAYITRRFPFEINLDYPGYKKSGVKADIELFSVLIYLHMLAEAHGHAPYEPAESFVEAAVFNKLADIVTRSYLGLAAPHPRRLTYLEARFSYLLLGFASACRDAATFDAFTVPCGLRGAMEDLGQKNLPLRPVLEAALSLVQRRDPIAISAHVPNAGFRLDLMQGNWGVGDSAASALEDRLGPRAQQGDVALLSSSSMTVARGAVPCSLFANATHEFVHVAIPIRPGAAPLLADVNEAELSVGVAISGTSQQTEAHSYLFAVPAIVDFHYRSNAPGGLMLIRINMYGLLEQLEAMCRELSIDLPAIEMFIVRCSAFSYGQTGIRVATLQEPRVPVTA